VQLTALILVILIDGPMAENDGKVTSLEAGAWLLVGCLTAAMFLSWLWSGRCAPLLAGQWPLRPWQLQSDAVTSCTSACPSVCTMAKDKQPQLRQARCLAPHQR
jgi:hypothetical protein